MTGELLQGLLAANLAISAAIVAALCLRGPVRRRFGARVAYGLWLAAPLAMLAVFIPRPQGLLAPADPIRHAAGDAVATALEAMPHAITAPAPAVLSLPTLLMVLWLAGCAGAAILTALAHRRGMASFGGLSAPGPRGVVRAANTGLGPAMVGIWRPRLVLPADFEARFDAREQALILAHERHHDLCGDTRINGLVSLICCLNWFNPLVHLAAYLLRVDQELACDAAVVERFPGERRTYAEALLKSQLACVPLPLGCTWPGRSPHLLQERLTMLAFNTPGRRQLMTGGALVGALCLGGAVTAWAASGIPVSPDRHVPVISAAIAPSPETARIETAPVEVALAAETPSAPVGAVCLSNGCAARPVTSRRPVAERNFTGGGSVETVPAVSDDGRQAIHYTLNVLSPEEIETVRAERHAEAIANGLTANRVEIFKGHFTTIYSKGPLFVDPEKLRQYSQ